MTGHQASTNMQHRGNEPLAPQGANFQSCPRCKAAVTWTVVLHQAQGKTLLPVL